MFQIISVIVILSTAIGYCIFSITRKISRKDFDSPCSKCSGCEFKEEILKKNSQIKCVKSTNIHSIKS